MIGYITLLKDEKNISEEQKNKFVDVIYENIKYLNRLCEDFFSYLKFLLYKQKKPLRAFFYLLSFALLQAIKTNLE